MTGLGKVAAEFAMATKALNLTRMWRLSPRGKYPAQRKSKPHRATTSLECKWIMEITKNSPRQQSCHTDSYTPPLHEEKEHLMNTATVSSSFIPDPVAAPRKTAFSRCPYLYPNRKRCSLPGFAGPSPSLLPPAPPQHAASGADT